MTDDLYIPGKSYDAIFVLGGGIVTAPGGGYRSTLYQDGDLTGGMLGGRMRIFAAAVLAWLDARPTNNFVFTSGISDKSRKQFSPRIPPAEAPVYADEFRYLVHPILADLEIVLENRSTNTNENIIEILRIIAERGWRKVAILTSEYHVPRTKALVGHYLGQTSLEVSVDFLSAEAIVTHECPGVFNEMITDAYASDLADIRKKSEAEGLERIGNGTYVFTEVQLIEAA